MPIYAYRLQPDSSEQVVGKLQMVSYTPQNKKLYIIGVNGADVPNTINLQNTLNKIYAQALITWQVERLTLKQTVTFPGGQMTHGGSNNFTTYNADQKAILTAFEQSGQSMEATACYLFFIDNVQQKEKSIAGYMPLQRQAGFIYDNPDLNIIAHELAHGAFNLYHTFSDNLNIAKEGSTQNLMDYNGGTELWKHQWDLIHDPENMLFAFMQDESEGEYSSTFFDEKFARLFNHVYDNNHKGSLTYRKKIRSTTGDDFELDYKESENKEWIKTWKVRRLTGEEVFANVTKAIKEAKKDAEIGKITLRPKHIYLGKCNYEGEEYPYAIYRDYDGDLSQVTEDDYAMDEVFTKIQVSEINELADIDKMKYIYSDETRIKYIVIGLIERGKKKPSVIIQIEKFIGDKTLEKWLEYLGIYKPEPSVFYTLKEKAGEVGSEYIIKTGEYLRERDDFIATKSIEELESKMKLYDDGYSNFDTYLEEAKKANYSLSAQPGWSVRNASYDKKKNLTLITTVIKKILDNKSSFGLNEKGIFLGKYDLEGTEYKLAVYSELASASTTKVRVGSLSELSGDAPIKVGVNENYVLIAFFNSEKALQFVIQIDHGSIETAKLWLKYLGILVEDEQWLIDVALPFWENMFGIEGDIEELFTEEQLKTLYPNADEKVLKDIFIYIDKYKFDYDIDNCTKLVHFLSQADHESGGFKYMKEIGSFSGERDKYRGRGIFQLTWKGNYQDFQAHLKTKGIEVDLVNKPELVEEPEYAVLSAFWYWQNANINSLAKDLKESSALLVSKKINCGNTSYCGCIKDSTGECEIDENGQTKKCTTCAPNGWDDRKTKFTEYIKLINCK